MLVTKLIKNTPHYKQFNEQTGSTLAISPHSTTNRPAAFSTRTETLGVDGTEREIKELTLACIIISVRSLLDCQA